MVFMLGNLIPFPGFLHTIDIDNDDDDDDDTIFYSTWKKRRRTKLQEPVIILGQKCQKQKVHTHNDKTILTTFFLFKQENKRNELKTNIKRTKKKKKFCQWYAKEGTRTEYTRKGTETENE